MIKNRKAALLFSAPIAKECTKECIIDAEKSGNVYEMFFAYCNHVGNAIIAGDYDEAKTVINKADELRKNSRVQFPSIYKIENNRLLLEYLVNECNANNKSDIISVSLEMANKFEKLLSNQGEEHSHVIELNCISLRFMSQTLDIASIYNLLDESRDDAYYSYFLHDYLLAHFIISKDRNSALREFHIINDMEVPLLNGERFILKARNRIQKAMIEKIDSNELSPYDYHKAISEGCSRVQDPSCYFWGRGFLLSDLQYLSFN